MFVELLVVELTKLRPVGQQQLWSVSHAGNEERKAYCVMPQQLRFPFARRCNRLREALSGSPVCGHRQHVRFLVEKYLLHSCPFFPLLSVWAVYCDELH